MPKIEYKIIRSKSLAGSVGIRIKNGEVIVRAPFWVPKIFIENFVSEKEAWIIESLKKTKPAETVKSYEAGESHLLFGVPHSLHFIEQSKPVRTSIAIENNNLLVSIYAGFDKSKKQQEVKDAMLRFYLERGIEYLTEKVNFYTNLLGVEYSRIDIKKVSSIWGSCSAGNALSFNRKLVMAPYEIIDYVIIHEVCHLIERNHSSRFWGLVFKYDREYKSHRLWLHRNHSLLTI